MAGRAGYRIRLGERLLSEVAVHLCLSWGHNPLVIWIMESKSWCASIQTSSRFTRANQVCIHLAERRESHLSMCSVRAFLTARGKNGHYGLFQAPGAYGKRKKESSIALMEADITRYERWIRKLSGCVLT